MIDTPVVVTTDTQPAALIHLTIPRDQMRHVMGPAIQELMGVVAGQGVGPAGALFTHHVRMHPDTFDFHVGVPVHSPVRASGRVIPGELPAARVARATYRGPYEGLSSGWHELGAWIAAEGHVAAPNLWEVYVAGPESGDDPSAWRTELNRPLQG